MSQRPFLHVYTSDFLHRDWRQIVSWEYFYFMCNKNKKKHPEIKWSWHIWNKGLPFDLLQWYPYRIVRYKRSRQDKMLKKNLIYVQKIRTWDRNMQQIRSNICKQLCLHFRKFHYGYLKHLLIKQFFMVPWIFDYSQYFLMLSIVYLLKDRLN